MIVNGKTQGMWPTWMYEAKVETHEEIYKEFSPCLDDDSFFEDTWIYGSCRSSIRSKKMMPYLGKYFLKILDPIHNSILMICNL